MLNSLDVALSRKLISNHGVLIYTFWDRCNKPLSNGVLFFTVAGQQQAKPIIVTTAHANPDFPDQKLTNFIRLNSMGQIPEECKIDFIVTDENNKTELYDIYIFSSDVPIEELEADSPYSSFIVARFQEFLIQILNDRPFLEPLEESVITVDANTNFIDNGQLNLVTIIQNPLIATHDTYAITNNLTYQVLPITPQKNPIVKDILSIDDVNDGTVEGKPSRCLTVIARNQNQLQPQARKLSISFSNSSPIFKTPLYFVIFIKSVIPANISLELSSTVGTATISSFAIDGLGNWEKVQILIAENFLISSSNPITISLLLPQNNFTMSFTNIGLFKADNITYPSTFGSNDIPQFPSPLMNSPIGFITTPMTVGRITEYLDEDSDIIEDKPNEIYADGRAVKRTSEYIYNKGYFAKVPIRIPYQYLYDKIGSKYGSGDQFINAVDMSNFQGGFDYCDIIFHTNAPMFEKNPNVMISNGTGLFAGNRSLISRGYDASADYSIKTYFLNESSALYSLGIAIDSGYCDDSVTGDKKTDSFSVKKHQFGYSQPNNNQDDVYDSYSMCKSFERSFVLIGEQNLPTTLFVNTNANRKATLLCASTLASNSNFNFIDGDSADTTKNYSLRYCLDTNANTSAANDVPFKVFKYNASAKPSHAVIRGHNVDFAASNILSQKQNIVPMKYQIAGLHAIGFKMPATFTESDVYQSSFEINYKNKKYYCWFPRTVNSTPTITNPAQFEDIIGIYVTDFSKASVVKAICEAINSYIFCIPDLRGTFNFAAGAGIQSSELNNIGIDWSSENNPSRMKQILTHDFKNYINFIPSFNLHAGATNSNPLGAITSIASGGGRFNMPMKLDYQALNDIPRVLTRKYISLC